MTDFGFGENMERIRRAVDGDIPAVLGLLEQVNKIHHDGRPDIFNLATKYSAEELSAIFADESSPVFVFDDGGTVLGYVFCVVKDTKGDRLLADMKSLYIDDLCVDSSARGRHIGQKLYECACSFAKDIGCYNVTLNVWALNGSARAFYEKIGMKVQKIGMETIL